MQSKKVRKWILFLTMVRKRLLLKHAMTNIVKSNEQVLTRQAAEIYMCSSRNDEMSGREHSRWLTQLIVIVWGCGPFLNKPMRTSGRTI